MPGRARRRLRREQQYRTGSRRHSLTSRRDDGTSADQPSARYRVARAAQGATTPAGQAVPRCHTSQLTAAYTWLNAAMGGVRGMTLILTNHSGTACHVYGYPGVAFFDDRGFPWSRT
jgi:Domain of unknown function (DUF4232)